MRRMFVRFTILLSLMLPAAPAGDAPSLFRAIRNGDVAFIKAHLTKAEIEVRDGRGATPLMHAAAFGNLQTLKLLLEAGADVNAQNDFDATALLWAARDSDKARLLIDYGADVNTQSKQGRTPLMVASLRRGGSPIVALMLEKGAEVNSKGGRRSETALGLAASMGNFETMRLLLAKGADPNAKTGRGNTAIAIAAVGKQPEAVRLLIQKDVDVNVTSSAAGQFKNGPATNFKVTALHRAAAFGPVEMVHDLLKAGANIHARDGRGLAPLFHALATEYPSTEIVQTLIQAGADVNARDTTGESPLDWAEKFSFPDVITTLKKAGAKQAVIYDAPKPPAAGRPKPAVALARSITLLESTSAEYFKRSGCVGCHHQPLIARAQFSAKAAGVSINESVVKEQLLQMKGDWISLQEGFLQADLPGGGVSGLLSTLLGLSASNYPPDTITDSAIVDVAESQEPDGSWAAEITQHRPPIAESVFASTARAIRVLQAYSIPARKPEFGDRIARAKAWLNQAKPVTTEDFSMRLSGFTWSGAAAEEVKNAAKALIALQRPDGGWGGNPYLKSDAYATAVALVALAESKAIKVSDSPYQRGIDYLLSTQFPDGSWYVRSRAIKFQPYFESGFPFGHDQWISAAATSWAAQALALRIIQPPL